ncbi:unnamed protein product [Angiostrongylus costaricensis]|uniref:Ovule protein n=1 Tax=Angiostrongylus costaricensis TaxID=334426 RepID=A0A0R3PZP1_ANGCS|nr:unnamed protein product [Angiostrongylus costaricensis]
MESLKIRKIQLFQNKKQASSKAPLKKKTAKADDDDGGYEACPDMTASQLAKAVEMMGNDDAGAAVAVK